MTISMILNGSVEDIVSWAVPEFFCPLDNNFSSPEDMVKISEDMLRLVNQYSFLASALAVLKVQCRIAKNSRDKKQGEELIDKREVLQKALDSVKLKQSTLSRMITIKQEIDKEISMSGPIS